MTLNGGDDKLAISTLGACPGVDPPDLALMVLTRPSTFTPRLINASRSIVTNASAGSGIATPPTNPASPIGSVPEISSELAPRPRKILKSFFEPRAVVVARFTIVTNDAAGGPVMIETGAPTAAPGLIFKSSALSVIVSALTCAP